MEMELLAYDLIRITIIHSNKAKFASYSCKNSEMLSLLSIQIQIGNRFQIFASK